MVLEVEMDDELEDDCGLFVSLLFGSILCCGKFFVLWLMVVLFFRSQITIKDRVAITVDENLQVLFIRQRGCRTVFCEDRAKDALGLETQAILMGCVQVLHAHVIC